MITIPFLPNPKAPFSFSPVLDGTTYSATVLWNIFRQGWYLKLSDQGSSLIVYCPVVESPLPFHSETITWNATTQKVSITTSQPHPIPLGRRAIISLRSAVPDAYNGVWTMTATGPSSLSYPQTIDPGGVAFTQGLLAQEINLVGGFFKNSSLIFRDGNFIIFP